MVNGIVQPVNGFLVLRLDRIHDVDVILCEGWHADSPNRVLLYRESSGKGLKLPIESCIAVVSDVPLDTGEVPLFPLDDVRPLADALMVWIAQGQGDQPGVRVEAISNSRVKTSPLCPY